MLEELKKRVYDANMALPKHGLVTFTWGNASEIDRESGLFAIKPSGVDYEDLKPEDMVIMDLEGNVVEGKYRPSTDMETHRKLYIQYPQIGGVVHTHSTTATGWAQTGQSVPCFGTTHADYFYGEIPCTRDLTEAEIEEAYEWNTGNVIVETIGDRDVLAVPGILVAHHGPFSWGKDAAAAVYHAVVLEEVCKMAVVTKTISPDNSPAPSYLKEKHYQRKHGKNAYYGQK